jgi:hypothetical protein
VGIVRCLGTVRSSTGEVQPWGKAWKRNFTFWGSDDRSNILYTLNLVCQPPGTLNPSNRQQMAVGACSEGDVAATVLTRILGHYKSSGHMLCDAGSLAMSKVICMSDGIYPCVEVEIVPGFLLSNFCF